MNQTQNDFRSFLVRAKRATYASSAEPAGSTRPRSVDLIYREDDFLYIDTYLGELDFIGEEAVWRSDRPLWGMNYYGRLLVDVVPEGFSRCLKEALMNVPFEAPFRGPQCFSSGDLEYHCRWEGDLGFFSGREEICQQDRPIYELLFHGGFTRTQA